jgi:hypothetical protein
LPKSSAAAGATDEKIDGENRARTIVRCQSWRFREAGRERVPAKRFGTT